jgi:hypothetical protein
MLRLACWRQTACHGGGYDWRELALVRPRACPTRHRFCCDFHQCDQSWAEWIVWQLREAGETVTLQAWHFRPGANFVSDIQHALAQAAHVVAVLSPEYLKSEWSWREWAASIDRLIPVPVRACQPPGLLKKLVYIDLVGCDQSTAGGLC